MTYLYSIMEDACFAVDDDGKGIIKEVDPRYREGKVELSGSIFTYDDWEHEDIYTRTKISKEQFDSFGKTWIIGDGGSWPNPPKEAFATEDDYKKYIERATA